MQFLDGGEPLPYYRIRVVAHTHQDIAHFNRVTEFAAVGMQSHTGLTVAGERISDERFQWVVHRRPLRLREKASSAKSFKPSARGTSPMTLAFFAEKPGDRHLQGFGDCSNLVVTEESLAVLDASNRRPVYVDPAHRKSRSQVTLGYWRSRTFARRSDSWAKNVSAANRGFFSRAACHVDTASLMKRESSWVS